MKKLLVLPVLFYITTLSAQITLIEGADTKFVKTNLGKNVNTAYYEALPIISADGKTLYICRADDPVGMGGEDIYVSHIQSDGSWGKAENIGSPLNNNSHNAILSILPDNNTAYVTNIYRPDGTMASGLSVTKRTLTGWEIPKEAVIKNFSNSAFGFQNFTLSSTRKTLVMSITTPTTKGEQDLYVSFLQSDGSYSEPLNMGSDINTSSIECSPYIASDDKTLYFSSAGHQGYGYCDVFVTRRLDDTWTKWSKPQNLGPNINTSEFDGFFTVPASGAYAYFSSSKDSYGQADIFQIELPKAAKPEAVVLIKGKVLNKKDGTPIATEVVYTDIKTKQLVGTANSNPVDGAYQIVLTAGKQYSFRAEKVKFYSNSENIDLSKIENYQEKEINLYLTPIEVGGTVRLNNIFFETNKAILKNESFEELDRLVIFLKSNTSVTIEIQGYTDNVGSDEHNLLLSQQRSTAVFDYLVGKEIEKNRLQKKGYGKTNPAYPNDTQENKAKNRRVEFKILKN